MNSNEHGQLRVETYDSGLRFDKVNIPKYSGFNTGFLEFCEDNYVFYFTMICSFFAFMFIHHVFSPRISSKYWKKYATLSRELRMEWDSRIMSSTHSIIVTTLSFVCLLYTKELIEDTMSGQNNLAKLTLSITVGYMVADTCSMPLYWRGAPLIIYIIHHGVAIIAFYTSVHFRVVSFFAILRLTCELSTPFANQRWFYLHLGRKFNEFITMFNSVVFAVTFFLVRNVTIPYFWWKYVLIYNTEQYIRMERRVPTCFITLVGSSIILDVLNLYWSKKVYRGSFKAVLYYFHSKKTN